jgi:hypothetical protein
VFVGLQGQLIGPEGSPLATYPQKATGGEYDLSKLPK